MSEYLFGIQFIRKKNLKSGCVNWVGSLSEIAGDVCDYSQLYNATSSVLDRINIALKWIDLPPSKRPSLLTLYFEGVDSAGHNYGVNNYEKVGAEMKKVDDGIKHLLYELDQKSHLFDAQVIIVSDHGMFNLTKANSINLDSITVNLSSCLLYSDISGPTASFYPKNASCHSQIKNVLLLYTSHLKIFEKNINMPNRYHYSSNVRIPDILAETTMGWYVTDTKNSGWDSVASHGWDNELLEMQSIFIAKGSMFNTTTKLDSFPNVEIYNLICDILGINDELRAPNNGTGLLKKILVQSPK